MIHVARRAATPSWPSWLAAGAARASPCCCARTLRLTSPSFTTSSSESPRRPRTALFFPGQGVQRVGMTSAWLDAFPSTVRPLLDEIDSVLGFSLSQLIHDGPSRTLTATANAQPAIMATSIVILRVLERDFGFRTASRVDFTLGHSLGEFAALVAGGYLRFDDALYLVRRRAEVMARISASASEAAGGTEFGMVALIVEDEARLNQLLSDIYDFIHLSSAGAKHDSAETWPAVEQVSVANINSTNQLVLSGNIERIHELLQHVRSFGGHDPRQHQLKADSPFHSPILRPAREAMTRMLSAPSPFTGGDIVAWPGAMPCISNVSAHPLKSREQLKDHLARQCVETVHWRDSIRYLDRTQRVRRWIGIGPGYVGRNLVGKEVGMKGAGRGAGVWGVTSPKEVEEIVRQLNETEEVDDEED